MFKAKNRKLNKKSLKSAAIRSLIAKDSPNSIISEQFRTIRTNIEFSRPDQIIKTILVTSSIPGEGKSTIAANLGVVFANEGKRVLLVDADMRRPTLHNTFSIFNIEGLSTVLTKQSHYFLAMKYTSVENLNLIPSGPIPPNPSELLSSKKFEAFLEDVYEDFDIIIFDAPPLLSVTDAQILSHKCDGTLLIVNSGNVDKSDVLKAKARIESVKANILGVVLNNYNYSKNKQYDYY